MAETDAVGQEDSYTPAKAGTYRSARYPGFYGGEVDSTGNIVKATPAANPAKNYQKTATGSLTGDDSKARSLSDIYSGSSVPDAPKAPQGGGFTGMLKSAAPSIGGWVGGNIGSEFAAAGATRPGGSPGLSTGKAALSSITNLPANLGNDTMDNYGGNTYKSGLDSPRNPTGENTLSAQNKATVYGAAGAGIGTAAVGLATGQSAKQAGASGLGAAGGYAVGQHFFNAGGTGAAIGAAIAGHYASKSDSGSGSSVICTELFSQGRMSLSNYSDDSTHTDRHVSPSTVRGYHLIAIPIVRMMRKSRALSRFLQSGANWRAEECSHRLDMHDLGGAWSKLAWINGGNLKGKLIRILLEPICFGVGLLIPEQEYKRLYWERT